MSKLIVLSNRVSLPQPDILSAGGLAVALQDALQDVGGIWLGWNGRKINNQQLIAFESISVDHVEYLTCPLTQQQYQHYYSGYANSVLWPAMHDRDDLIQEAEQDFLVYQQVNEQFARKLAEIAQPEDMIWVHDYHFLSIAHYCRKFGMQNRIGFFLHIPFAPLNMWQNIRENLILVEHLAKYDVVGLQTEQDQHRCMHTCSQLLGALQLDAETLCAHQHCLKVKCYPIGVNPDAIQQAAEKHDLEHLKVFNVNPESTHKTIIGVDRIDYSKGLLERFVAYEEFLKRHPEMHAQITDLQVACPCRMEIPAYEALFSDLKEKIEQINQDFAQQDWQPVNCTNQTIEHDDLMQIYRVADICWVNSLRDGMNLVAKEYIAAQNPDNPGVLILSKYAGAAEQMPEAILVDPEDPQNMISALEQAIIMHKHERLERYQQLIEGIKRFDINDWRNAFLNDLMQSSSIFIKNDSTNLSHVIKTQPH